MKIAGELKSFYLFYEYSLLFVFLVRINECELIGLAGISEKDTQVQVLNLVPFQKHCCHVRFY